MISSSPFLSIVDSLVKQNQHEGNQKINKKQLKDFEKEYIFLALTETKTFGQLFCERFLILDYILLAEKDYKKAVMYIKDKYTK